MHPAFFELFLLKIGERPLVTTHVLTRHELLEFIEERGFLFDEQDNPFSSSSWLKHFVCEVAPDEGRYIVPEGTDLGSIMLLHEVKPRQLAALTNYYGSLYSPAANGRNANALIEQLATFYKPSTLTLAPLDATEAAALSFPGFYARRYHCFANWHLPCQGLSFDAYMAARPSQLRNTWKRKSKKFGGRLEIIASPEDVERGIAAYQHIYSRSWKVPEPYPNFVPGWARICARAGMLRLGIAWLGDVPIAASFWFLWHGRAYIFKLAYDESFKQLSAGTLLTAHLMRHALDEDRVIEVDYLSGDDAYKRDWMSHRRERVGIIACSLSSATGILRAAYEWAGATRQRMMTARSSTVDGSVTYDQPSPSERT